MKIDIITTATIRPDILERTYSSFTKNLLCPRDRFRLLLNIDSIGDSRYSVNDVLNVAETFFDNIKYNVPDEPNLSKAVKWCFNNVENDYVFYLEDDWNMLFPLNIDKMIDILNNNPNLASLGLNQLQQEKFIGELKSGEWESQEAIQRNFAYLIHISLNPVLIKKEFVRGAGKLLRTNYKPESQLRRPNPAMRNHMSKWKFASYITSKYGFSCVIEDIGRQWLENSDLKKAKKDGFLFWKKR